MLCSVKNGERLISSFNNIPFDQSAPDLEQYDSFPQRVTDRDWSARASEAFALDGVSYIAVASSDPDGTSPGGGVDIMKWHNGSFVRVQDRTDDPGACSVSYFSAVDGKGTRHHYIAVANSEHTSLNSDRSPLRVYRYAHTLVPLERTNVCAS